jgi:hypothetical protein
MIDRVECPKCDELTPRFCARCTYLMNNMHLWRELAMIEHVKSCTERGDHNHHIETMYGKLRKPQ